MKNKKGALPILAVLALACLLMGVVDALWQPGYVIKSAVKLGLFLGLPWLVRYRIEREELRSFFRLDGRLFRAVSAGLGIYGLITGGYFLVSRFFDFSGVTGALEQDVGVTAGNFLLVAVYISFVNSLLEEFFFRGFAFLSLRQQLGEGTASLCSAGAFALYHVAMLLGWFRWDLLCLLIAGLLAAGLLFNRVDRRSGTLWNSWCLHMFANFAINTVGVILLYTD